jgi:hypothetical protein
MRLAQFGRVPAWSQRRVSHQERVLVGVCLPYAHLAAGVGGEDELSQSASVVS